MELFDVFVIVSLHPRAVQISEILLPGITVGSVWAVLHVGSSLAEGRGNGDFSKSACGVSRPDLFRS